MPESTITVTLSREEAEKVTALVELEARPGSPVPSPPVREVLASAGPKLRAALTSPQPERCDGSGQIPTGECRVAMSGPTCGIRRCPPCQSPETEPCPGCPACQPEQEGEAGDWPAGDGWSAPDEAIRAAWKTFEKADGVPHPPRNLLALAVSAAFIAAQPAPAQHPTGLSEGERERLREIAESYEWRATQTANLNLANSCRRDARFLLNLADQQGRD